METIKILERLLHEGKITRQAYRTYMGQIKHGDESACIIGLQRKHLIEGGKGKDGKEIITTRTGREDIRRSRAEGR